MTAQSIIRALAALIRPLHERTILVLGIMLGAGVLLTLWHLSRLTSNLVESAAVEGTSLQCESLQESRMLYASDVVGRIRAQGVTVTHDYAAHDGAIPIPATFSMELGRRIGERG